MDFQDLVVVYLQRKYLSIEYQTYLEIGAHDGLEKSNCYFLMESNWSGVCIEPNPITFQRLQRNRPGVEAINAAFADPDAGVSLSYYWPNGRESNGTVCSSHPIAGDDKSNIVQVKSIDVRDLVSRYPDHKIGYISIDTEGGEIEIARNILSKSSLDVAIITVEHNFDANKHVELNKLFDEAGYSEILNGLCRNDALFVKDELFRMEDFT